MDKEKEDAPLRKHKGLELKVRRRTPNFLRWRGSVIPKAFLPALMCAIVAAIVTYIQMYTKTNLSIPQTFVPVLGLIVGLLLTYRTNTAYDRYWEGRRTWSILVIAIRNLTRLIWVNVRETEASHVLEKKTAINLLQGFAVATKHYLREENGTEWEDLRPLISNIESRLPGFEPLIDQDLGEELVRQSKEEGRPQVRSRMPFLHLKPHQRPKGTPSPVNHNLPLEISLYLSSYIRSALNRSNVDAPTASNMVNNLNQMVDCLTTFERILRSPIPLAYSIHLSQVVWLYCLTLPFQFAAVIHWSTVPMVFLASMVFLGLEKIGEEIENPFGYDYNDLDLDDFCNALDREIKIITAHPPPKVEEWVYAEENHPFGPAEISANDARKLSLDEVRSLLEKDEVKDEVKEESKEKSKEESKDVVVKVN